MSDDVVDPAAGAVSGAVADAPIPAAVAPQNTPVEGGNTPPVAPAVVEPAWRDDWRQKLAGEDKADLKTLERIASVEDIWKQNKLLRQKMSSGELKKDLPANATPEQVAEWRRETGLPEKPEDYKLDLGGFIPSEADQPILNEFKALALEQNMPPAQVSRLVKWFFENHEKALVQKKNADDDADLRRNIATETELRTEWGKDYKSHLSTLNMYLDYEYGAGARALLMSARAPDGSLLSDNPAFLRAFAGVAVNKAPLEKRFTAGEYVAGRGGEDRIAEIEKFMRTNRAEYFKDKNMDAEYKALIDARDRAKARAA